MPISRTGTDKFRILLVDDEPDIVATIEKALHLEGFLVEAYTDPQEALRAFRPDYYDLALLDIRMPTLSGFDLYREIKKKDEKTKVCFITAFEIYYDEFKRMFPALRVTCFVRKPVRLAELTKVIRQELEADQDRT